MSKKKTHNKTQENKLREKMVRKKDEKGEKIYAMGQKIENTK